MDGGSNSGRGEFLREDYLNFNSGVSLRKLGPGDGATRAGGEKVWVRGWIGWISFSTEVGLGVAVDRGKGGGAGGEELVFDRRDVSAGGCGTI